MTTLIERIAALVMVTWVFALAITASAAPPPEPAATLPAAGTHPWGENPLVRLMVVAPKPGDAALEITTLAEAPIAGDAATQAATLATITPVPQFYSSQAKVLSTQPIARSSTVFVEFYMRTLSTQAESGEGQVTVVVEENKEPYSKSLERWTSSPADGRWVRRAMSFRARQNYAAGQASFSFMIGQGRPQKIQITNLRIVDLGAEVDPLSLPVQRMTYPGRDADARWRAAAAARIEQVRKNDLRIEVVDERNQPVADAQLTVQMQQHAFAFGSAVAAGRLMNPGPDRERYRAWILANCTRVVMENDLKWPSWEAGADPKAGPGNSRATTLAALQWLNEQNIQIKGHNLIWPSWRFSPPRLKALKNNPDALRQACVDHITDILRVTGPHKLVEWDVVNENFDNHDITDILGPEEIVRWFQQAREQFPAGRLIYNDYAHLTSSHEYHRDFKQFAENLVKRLNEKEKLVDALGVQSHFGQFMLDPATVISELDRLTRELNVDIAISEFDINTTDEAAQADYTRDFMTACFSHPRVTSFMLWGFWEGSHWLPAAAMIRKDWTLKPAALAWNELLRKTWWTDVSTTCDARGQAMVRGFKGRYLITARGAGKIVSTQVELGDKPAQVRLVLGATAR